MAIPLAAESAPAPAALVDRDRMLIVELREADDAAAEGAMLAARGGRIGKRGEYRCAACGSSIVVYGQAPSCPICSERRWEHVEWRPFSQLLDFSLPDLSRSVGPSVSRLARGGERTVSRRRLPSLATRTIEASRQHGPFDPRYRPRQPSAPSVQLTRAPESTAVQAWEQQERSGGPRQQTRGGG